MTVTAAGAKPSARAEKPRLTWRLIGKTPKDIEVSADDAGGSLDEDWHEARGAGVRVCVIDSGVDRDHPLVGGLSAAYAVVDGDAGLTVEETETGDAFGHGTACAGIIRRVAPDCDLYSVRVLGERGTGNGDMLVAGLRWAVKQNFDVINMSLSTTKVRFVEELRSIADEAVFRGSAIVASAHNTHIESFPWRFSSVISVGSHQEEADPELVLYNPEPPVEYFALGQNVEVAWSGGKTIRSTGNSFATPFVAGLCARILSRHPRMTMFQLKNALYLSAANVNADTGGVR